MLCKWLVVIPQLGIDDFKQGREQLRKAAQENGIEICNNQASKIKHMKMDAGTHNVGLAK
jgi:hypothetical protein